MLSNILKSSRSSSGSSVWEDNNILSFADDADISLAQYTDKSLGLNGSLRMDSSFVSPSGLTLFALGAGSVHQYSLSTAWEITSITYTDDSFSVLDQDLSPKGIFFKPDGLAMYMVGTDSDTVYQYTLSTAWDIATATYSGKSFFAGVQSSSQQTVRFSPDGLTMFTVGGNNSRIYQYTLSTAWDVSTASYAGKTFFISLLQNGLEFKSDGTTFIATANDFFVQFNMSTAWDISTASQVAVSIDYAYGSSLSVKPDGSAFVLGGSSNVYKYTLSTAWDVTTARRMIDTSNEDTSPAGVAFKSDGLVAFVVGTLNARIYKYNLTTPWILSSALYTGESFYVGDRVASPSGLNFSLDGLRMFVNNDSIVCQYVLTSAWEFPPEDKYFVLAQTPTPTGIFFKSDGLAMYVVGSSSDTVFQYSLSTAWDVTTASYTGKSFSVRSQDSGPSDIFFKPDGLAMYIVGYGSDMVYQYTLSTAWDVSTASYANKSFSVATQDGTPADIFFKPDGLAMYIVGSSNDRVYQYTLSTAWDVSTASYANKSFSVATQETAPTGLFFKPDGLAMYIVGSSNDRVYQYTLSTAWDVSTASYANKSFSVATQETAPTGLFFKPDGLAMYIVGINNDRVYQYTLSTAWDVSTASYANKPFSVTGITSPSGLFFKPDGLDLYVVSSSTVEDRLYQYRISYPWDLNNAIYVPYMADVYFSPDGLIMFAAASSGKGVIQFQPARYNLSTAWDLESAAPSNYIDINVEDEPTGLFFKPDGLAMYVIGVTNDRVYQYTLSTAWDVTTASYTGKSFSVRSQDSGPSDIFFKPDGLAMYIVGSSNDRVYQYTLSTAWDVTTASYANKSFSVATRETSPTGLFFKPDGLAMYIVGSSSDRVYQYTLSTAWDVTTANYAYEYFFTGGNPQSVTFSPDGLNMFVGVLDDRRVIRYTLSSPWYVSTATPSNGVSVGSQSLDAKGVFIKPDGLTMFVVGRIGSYISPTIHQYQMSSPWTLYLAGPTYYENLTGLYFKPDGTVVFAKSSQRVYAHTLSTPWDLSTNTSGGPVSSRSLSGGLSFSPDGKYLYTGTYQYEAIPAWNIYNLVGVSVSLVPSNGNGIDTSPGDVFFDMDGLTMYIVGSSNDRVYQYTLSTAWDVSTASYANKSFSVATQETAPTGLFFKPDGLTMFVVGTSSDSVHKYNLSTAWDVSTASYANKSFSVAVQYTSPQGVSFSSDGLTMFVVAYSNIFQYNLSTAWDVSTASYSGVCETTPATACTGASFSSDGLTMLIVVSQQRTAFQYTLSTAWDVTTASYTSNSFSVGSQTQAFPSGIFLRPDALAMYIISDAVYQYRLVYAATPQLPYIYPTASLNDVAFSPDGKIMYQLGADTDRVYQYPLTTAWDITTSYNTGISFSVNAEEPTPTGLFFKPDGLAMYIVGISNDRVYQYTLSTAWDVSTASYTGKYLIVSSQETSPQSIFFTPDGLTLFVLGAAGDDITQYNLSTAWDVSSASYANKSFSVVSQDAAPTGIFFKPDGLTMFVVGTSSDRMHRYTLSTAWDITTASYDGISATIAANPAGIFISPSGIDMYIATSSTVKRYKTDEAWNMIGGDFDATSAFYTGATTKINDQDTLPQHAVFTPDGLNMYMLGEQNNSVYQYTLSTAWDITTAVYTKKTFIINENALPQGLSFSSDGLTMHVLGQSGRVYQYTLSTAWDITTASYTNNSFDTGVQDAAAEGMSFGVDGLTLFVVGSTNNQVYQYTLSTAWDITTASYTGNSFSVVAAPSGIFFKPDGLVMFILAGSTASIIYKYTLSTAWDITTASYTGRRAKLTAANHTGLFISPSGVDMYTTRAIGSWGGWNTAQIVRYKTDEAWALEGDGFDPSTNYAVSGISLTPEDSTPRGVFFKPDGLTMYMIGQTADSVYEYALSTAWDVSTASYTGTSFSVGSQETSPTGMFIKSDGLTMFVVGTSSDSVHKYNLSTAWDITTAVYSNTSFSVNAQDSLPQDVFFSSDGIYMFVVGSNTDNVYGYTLSTAWDITTASIYRIDSTSSYVTTPTGVSFSADGYTMYLSGYNTFNYGVYVFTNPFQWSSTTNSSYYRGTVDVGGQVHDVFPKPDGKSIFVLGGSVTEYASSIIVEDQSLNTSPVNETTPTDVFFKPDGLAMYVLGGTNRRVYQYSLYPAWDIATATFAARTTNVLYDSQPQGIFFKPDGLTMYVVGSSVDTVWQYPLSTAWDITTVGNYTNTFSILSQDTTSRGISFSSDGTRMFIIGTSNDRVYRYTLSTAWDVSTAAYVSYVDISAQDTEPTGIAFSSDGMRMFMTGNTGNTVDQYQLSSPWELSGMVSNGYFVEDDGSPAGLFVKPDDSVVYVIGSSSDRVREYGSIIGLDLDQQIGTRPVYEAATTGVAMSPDGRTMYLLGSNIDSVFQFNLLTPWNTSAANFSGKYFLLNQQDGTPADIFFKPDGLAMYIVGSSNDRVYQYTLSTAWDVSTASYANKSFSVATQETAPTGLFFKPDGLTMFVVGTSSDSVHKYNLSTAWDVSTASYTGNRLYVSNQDRSPTGISISPDGLTMYMVGNGSDQLSQYTLTDAWDISTARYTGLSINTGVVDPTGVYIAPNGSRIVLSRIGENPIVQYIQQ